MSRLSCLRSSSRSVKSWKIVQVSHFQPICWHSTGWPVKHGRFFCYLGKVTCPVYTCTLAYTGQVTFFKVPEKKCICLTCHPVEYRHNCMFISRILNSWNNIFFSHGGEPVFSFIDSTWKYFSRLDLLWILFYFHIKVSFPNIKLKVESHPLKDRSYKKI